MKRFLWIGALTAWVPCYAHASAIDAWSQPLFGTNTVWSDGTLSLTRKEMHWFLCAEPDPSWSEFVTRVQDSERLRRDVLMALPEFRRLHAEDSGQLIENVKVFFCTLCVRGKLGYHERRAVADAFWRIASDPTDEDYQDQGMEALGILGDSSDAGRVLNMMTNGTVKDSWVLFALAALGRWGAENAIPEISRRYDLTQAKAARGDEAAQFWRNRYTEAITTIRSNACLRTPSTYPATVAISAYSTGAVICRIFVAIAVAVVALAACAQLLRARRRKTAQRGHRNSGSL